MNTTRMIMRMARLARNPPKGRRLYFLLAMVAISLILVAIEKVAGSPDWMNLQRIRPF